MARRSMPGLALDCAACESGGGGESDFPLSFSDPMPFAPEVQQLIRQVEESSGLPVHVAEDPAMRLRASVTPARHGSPVHWVRFKPGSSALDYLVASQLVFLQRSLELPEADRWEIAATPAEQARGIRTMGLDGFDDGFARNMVG